MHGVRCALPLYWYIFTFALAFIISTLRRQGKQNSGELCKYAWKYTKKATRWRERAETHIWMDGKQDEPIWTKCEGKPLISRERGGWKTIERMERECVCNRNMCKYEHEIHRRYSGSQTSSQPASQPTNHLAEQQHHYLAQATTVDGCNGGSSSNSKTVRLSHRHTA